MYVKILKTMYNIWPEIFRTRSQVYFYYTLVFRVKGKGLTILVIKFF